LRSFVGVLTVTVVACGGDADLSPAIGVRHLGHTAGYEKIDRVSKAVLAAGVGSVSVDLVDLPSSRIHFAAARAEFESEDEAAAIACRVQIRPASGPSEQLVAFDLPEEEPRWIDAVASSPAVENGTLLLDCRRADGTRPAVVWARPVAVPLSTSRPAPLIVLFSLDTLRADHVTGFPGAADLSPNIGQFADDGLRLLDATSEGTWTLASHYSLLFSRMYGFPVDAKPLTSLAQALADGGFVTAALTGGGFMGAAFNYHLGFDHFVEYGTTNYDDLPFILTDVLPIFRCFEDAPTFVFLHTFAIHELPPSEIAWHEEHGQFRPFRPDPQQLKSARAFYAGVVRQTDAELAKLFDVLRGISEVRPVLLLILSDHGDAFGEHRNFRHGFGAPHVTLHDEIIHVPMIVWGPGLIPPGRSSRRPVMLVDVAPSILAAVGIAPPRSMRGTNLWPLWSKSDPDAVPPSLGSVSHTEGAWSLRTERAKLIVEMTRRRGSKGVELYDLEVDPGERNDLAGERPREVAAMLAQLRQQLSKLGVPLPPKDSAFPTCRHCAWQERETFWRLALEDDAVEGATAPGAVDEETLQRLRDLGYTD
jgi:arylsulfatase A-like enzyme